MLFGTTRRLRQKIKTPSEMHFGATLRLRQKIKTPEFDALRHDSGQGALGKKSKPRVICTLARLGARRFRQKNQDPELDALRHNSATSAKSQDPKSDALRHNSGQGALGKKSRPRVRCTSAQLGARRTRQKIKTPSWMHFGTTRGKAPFCKKSRPQVRCTSAQLGAFGKQIKTPS